MLRNRIVGVSLLFGFAITALVGCGSGAGAPAAPIDGFGGALGPTKVETELADLYNEAIAAGENQVVVYGPRYGDVVQERFEARFPGIKLVVQPVQAADRLAKLEQERQTGNHAGDVASDGRNAVLAMAEGGWCDKFGSVVDIPAEWKAAEETVLSPNVAVFGLIINTDLLDPEDAPKSWRELGSEEWRGKVVMVSPAAGGVAAYTLAQMETPEQNAKDFAGIKEAIRENVTLVATDALVTQEVAQGNYAIGALAYYPYFQEVRAQGAQVEFVFPFTEGGGNQWSRAANCQIVGAPHPHAAQLYLNWLFTEEGQKVLAESGVYPTMPGIKGPGGLPPLDTVDFIPELPDDQAATGYDAYIAQIISFFGG